MKKEQFEDLLAGDLAWRKMEISQLFRILQDVESKDVVSKSMVLLLYAHWEGFIKKSSKYYLKYISEKKVKIKDLTINFKAIVLKNYAKECIDNDGLNLAKELSFINKQDKMEEKKFKLNIDVENDLDEDIINTKHNLNSKVLKNISEIIGIKYNTAMASRSNYIDAMLLNNRNSIGHAGKIVNMGEEDNILEFSKVSELKDFVLIMLDYYAEVLQDYVANEFYLLQKQEECQQYEQQKEEKLNSKLKAIENVLTHNSGNLHMEG